MRDDDEDASPASAKGSRRSRTLRQQLTASPMSWGRSGRRGDGGSEYDSPASPPGPPEGDDDSAVSCSTPVALACKGGGGRVVDPADPDVLYFGDELRLWAVSEYAVARQARDGSSNTADLGGYVGVYFKGRKRRARTGAGKGRDVTSKAPSSVVFHSCWLIFGRAIIARNGPDAWMLSLERARAEHARRSRIALFPPRRGRASSRSRACRPSATTRRATSSRRRFGSWTPGGSRPRATR